MPPAKQKDQHTTRSSVKSTRNIRLLTPSSLKACSTFSHDKSLPDVTWEVLATTTASLGTSSLLPTVFPVFWESKEKTCYLITLRANKRIPFYKALQAYLQGSPQAVYHRLPQEASRLLLLLEACRFRHPLGFPHWPSQNGGKGESRRMESTIASVSRALISGVLGGFPSPSWEAEWLSAPTSSPRTASLQRHSSYKLLDSKQILHIQVLKNLRMSSY